MKAVAVAVAAAVVGLGLAFAPSAHAAFAAEAQIKHSDFNNSPNQIWLEMYFPRLDGNNQCGGSDLWGSLNFNDSATWATPASLDAQISGINSVASGGYNGLMRVYINSCAGSVFIYALQPG